MECLEFLCPVDLFVAPDVRYASYPTATTWYVTTGMWNSSTMENTASRKSSTRLSAHVSVGSDVAIHYAKNKETEDASNEGWWGQVAKTNDASQTWELVFDDQTYDQTSGLYANDSQLEMSKEFLDLPRLPTATKCFRFLRPAPYSLAPVK